MRKPKRPAGSDAGTIRHQKRRFIGVALLTGAILTSGFLYWHYYQADNGSPATLADVVSPGAAANYNVLVVTLDTVRRDRLGCYGYTLAETPTFDKLATEGVLFNDAVTSVPLTLPSHATLFTGLYPPHHGVRDNGRYRLTDQHPTLAKTLKAHGYDTAAFVGAFVVDARFGLDQGFDVYDFHVSPEGYRPKDLDFNERPANEVTDAAIRWLGERATKGAKAPFFMWVHYFDAHLPYSVPMTKEPRFANRGYDAEIAFIDHNLARLRSDLERRGQWNRTLVVLTSDHGESFGEHKEPTHGMLLYKATVQVPLIVSCPGLFKGPSRINDLVAGLVDVRPTLEDLLGISPTAPCDGTSLLRLQPDKDRAIYMETLTPLYLAGWSPLYALRTHVGKYILAPEPEYYDLEKDPKEQNNLAPRNPPEMAELAKELPREVHESSSGSAERPISDEEVRRLAALGYVQGPSSAGSRPRDDPKKMMDVFAKSQGTEELYLRGHYEQAAKQAQEVLAECKQCIQAQRVLAFSYLRLGQPAKAVALLQNAVREQGDVFLVRSLAEALIIAGDLEQAWKTLDLYASIDPTDGQVALLRGDILARQQRVNEAVASYEEAIRLDENRVGITARERIARLQRG